MVWGIRVQMKYVEWLKMFTNVVAVRETLSLCKTKEANVYII